MKYFYRWHPDSKDLFHLQLHGCNVLFRKKLEKLFFYFASFTHAQSTSNSKSKSAYLIISVLCACAPHPTMALASSGTKASATLWKNWNGHVCLLLFFSWMRESRTFERLSVFLENPIDFYDFLEQLQYSRNGRHIHVNKRDKIHGSPAPHTGVDRLQSVVIGHLHQRHRHSLWTFCLSLTDYLQM